MVKQIHPYLVLSLAVLLLLASGTYEQALAAPPIIPTGITHPQEEPPAATDNPLGDSFLVEYERLQRGGNPDAGEENPVQDAGNGSSLAATLVFSLLAIVGLIYAAVWVLRQVMGRRGAAASGADRSLLSLQESRDLGPHQKLHLVRMGDELLLLGATEQNITCLARFDDDQLPETFDEHLQQTSPFRPEQAAFERRQNGQGQSTSPAHSLDHLRRMRPWQKASGDD